MFKDKNIIDNKKIKKFPAFLISVIFIYGIVAMLDGALAWGSLREVGSVFLKMIPILIVVFVIMVLSNLFLTPERVKRHFGRNSGVKGWFYAMIFGIIIAGPPYILYPMLKELKKNGVENSHIAIFLYNRNVKLPFIPAMIYYFGWQYTVILSVLLVLFSIFNGLLMGKITNKVGEVGK